MTTRKFSITFRFAYAKLHFINFLKHTGSQRAKALFRPSQNPLDGVLDEYTKYTDEIPPIKKGAKDFIVKLSKDYDLILFTNRSPKLATEWLIDNKIDKYFADVTNVKPIASIYLDDRAVNFNGNYEKTFKEIKNFKVYWKH